MDQLIWKIKLAVLWIFQIVNFVAVLLIPYSFAIVREEIGEGLGALLIIRYGWKIPQAESRV